MNTSKAVTFKNLQGTELAGRLELPTGTPRATALFAHCFTCGKDIAAATRIARGLAARGFAVLRFDFTGLGGSDGDFANSHFSANVQDLVSAADWLGSELQAPALLIGHSLGGAAVLAAASRIESTRAVVTIGAPSEPEHVRHLFADSEQDIRKAGRADVQIAGRRFPISSDFLDDLEETRLRPSLAKLGKQGKATLILHSPQDSIVSIDHARKLYESLVHPKSFLTLDGADHLLTNKNDANYVADLIAAWSQRYLPEPQPEDVDAGADLTPGDVLVVGKASGFLQEVHAGDHHFIADEPNKVGGENRGPTPYDLLLAALGTCTSMTIGMYARHKKLPLESVQVRLRHDRVHSEDCEGCEDNPKKIDRIQRWLEIEGDLTDEQRARLLQIADRCPVHQTLEHLETIETSWEG